MQIAVPGMEDIAADEPILVRQCRDAIQHVGKRAAWDGSVHAQHVGLQPAHGAERSFAPGPDAGAFRFAGAGPQLRRAEPTRDLINARRIVSDLSGYAVDLGYQY